MNRVLALLLAIIGIVAIVVAIIYFVEPAKSLPSFIPGHLAHNTVHRWKRGVAAAVIGVVVLIVAALASRPRRPPPPPAPAA